MSSAVDSSLLLREPPKPVLANAIWDTLMQNSPVLTGKVRYVLDGDSLLQHILWTRGESDHLQGELYSVHRVGVCYEKYGEVIVVFDGNGESSAKDTVHQRRAKGQAGVNVTFYEDMKLTVIKAIQPEVFQQTVLTNIVEKGCKVYYMLWEMKIFLSYSKHYNLPH